MKKLVVFQALAFLPKVVLKPSEITTDFGKIIGSKMLHHPKALPGIPNWFLIFITPEENS
jgi:hypothetical protein